MFDGMSCQSTHQSQEHGKVNTELISKTSKERRFLPKITRTCPSVSAPLPIALSSRLHPASLRLHSIPSSSIHKLFLHAELEGATPSLLPSVLASARCKKLLASSQLGPFRNSAGAPTARAPESSFKHKAHTQNKLFKRALGIAKYWLGLCFISIR